MHRLAALAALATLLAGCAAPGPSPLVAPAASEGEGRFQTLECPFLLAPDPAHPLEVCNARATARSGPANEVDVAMDPADPLHLVLVAKAYPYARLVGDAFRGGVLTATAATWDGGRTWTEGWLQPMDETLLPLPAGLEVGMTHDHASDPVVEFASDGSVVAVVLRIGAALHNSLPAYRSEDGGATFAEAGTALDVQFTDKEWMASDPLTGNLYVATNAEGGPYAIRSRDGGRTWDAPVKLPCCSLPSVGVGPGGAVYVAGLVPNVAVSRSEDEGQTWSAPAQVGPYANWGSIPPYNGRLFRTPQIPQLASSPLADSIHVTWAQPPEGAPPQLACPDETPIYLCVANPNDDVLVASSLDGGATWSAPVRVNDDPTDLMFQFMPQVAVSPNGQDVHVAWLDQRHDPTGVTAEVYYAHSPDGGATWEPNLRISDAPFVTTLSHHQSLPGTSVPPYLWNGIFVGDYIGLAASDERAVIAWPDTRYGRADIFVATVV